MSATTTRGAFPYPTGTDNWKLIRTAIQALAEQMAAVGALYVESTAATRPAVGVVGRFHRATDTGALTLDTGSAWVAVPSAAGPAGFAQAAHGAIGARPAASAATADSFYLITDATGGGVVGTLYYCDGATWTPFTSKTLTDAAYIPNSLADAAGDLPVGTADNAWGRLPKGAPLAVLRVNAAGTALEYAVPTTGAHAARAVITTAQSIPNATYTAVAFASESLDTDAFHDNATNNTRLTIPAGLGGKYLVHGHFMFVNAAGGLRIGRIYKNGASQNLFQAYGDGTNYTTVRPQIVLSLAAGDYVELMVYQDSGGALAAAGTTGDYGSLDLVYLGT